MRLISIVFIITLNSCSVSNNVASKNSGSNTILHADNIVIAHRGAWEKNNLPENSITALKQAIALRCYGPTGLNLGRKVFPNVNINL